MCNPPALLSTILRNLQIDESRRDKPEKYMDDYSTALGIASNQAGPEDVVAREQVLKRISDVIERARGRLTRDIFFDIRIYKLSYKEIAQKNRVTPRAVERHVARAMEVLRECEELAELLK